jgi:Mrp family chromosome partitioning ATPase
VPYAPNPIRSAILGLAVGLFAGIGLAFLLQQFDTRLHGHAEISRILRMPVLGRVPRFQHKDDEGSTVVVVNEPEGHAAEAFRVVRSNLDFVSLDESIRSIAVSSCAQGEGKTVSVCNLAASLALAGKHVILVDADLRRSRIHKVFGLHNEQGVSSVVAGRQKAVEALQRVDVLPKTKMRLPEEPARGAAVGGRRHQSTDIFGLNGDGEPRFYVLTAGPRPPNPGEMVASQRFATMIGELGELCDLVLVDTPAFMAVGDAGAIAKAVDGLVFLVDLHIVRRPLLEGTAERLEQLPCDRLGVVVMRQKSGRGYYHDSYGSYRYTYHYTEDGQKAKRRARTHAPA